MSRLLSLLLVLGLFAVPSGVEAKGPKGKGGGSGFKGGGKSRGPSSFSRPGGQSRSVPTKSGRTIGSGGAKSDRSFGNGQQKGGTGRFGGDQATDRLKGRDHALNTQRFNEERKFTHRQQTAQKLREIGERNGNENLLRTADKMDQQALDHYDKRMSKIDSKTPQDGLDPVTDTAVDQPPLTDGPTLANQPTLANEVSAPLQDVGLLDSQVPDGLSATDARRLAQEEWKLQHQLDVAQRLRENAARNGNDNLLRTAERMETMAADRFQQQIDKLGVFQDLAPQIAVPPPPPLDPAI